MLAPRKTLWSTPDAGCEAACRLLRLGDRDKVVDVGCGDGRFLLEAARRGATAVGLEIDADRAEVARRACAGSAEVRTCNALDEAHWHDAFDDEVTCAFLYLVPRGLRLVAPRLLERAKTKPIRVVTYMAQLPGAVCVEKCTITPAHQPSAAWPLYVYDLGVRTVKVLVVGRDASLVVGAIAGYDTLAADEAPAPQSSAVARFARGRYGLTNIKLETEGEGPFDGYIVLASDKWRDYATAAHASDATLRLLADAGHFREEHARCAVAIGFEYVHAVDALHPKHGADERDKDGIPRIVEALCEADWSFTKPVETTGPHVRVTGPGAGPIYRALCMLLGAAPSDESGESASCVLATKYYTTPLTLSLATTDATEAVIYCGPPSVEAEAAFAADVRTRLLVVRGDDAAQAWCAQHGVELVSEAPAAAAARCRGALGATFWSSVAPTGAASRAPPPAARAPVAPTASPPRLAARAPAAPAAPPPPPPAATDGLAALEARASAAARDAPSAPGIDAFEAAVDAARATGAEGLSDADRRARAADVATKMFEALGVGDESDSDDGALESLCLGAR